MDIIGLGTLVNQAISFLKDQIAFHEKRAANIKGQLWRVKIHQETAAEFLTVIDTLLTLQAELTPFLAKPPKRAPSGHQLQLALEDVQGLPEELVKELSISDSDWTEFAIINLIEEAGGILSLDKILIGLYKKTGEIHKRSLTNNRLYRMSQKGMVFSVPNKKGAYSTREMLPEEVDLLVSRKPNGDDS